MRRQFQGCSIALKYYNAVSATTVFLPVPYGNMSVDVTSFDSYLPSSSIVLLRSVQDSSLQRKGYPEYKIAQAFANHFR